MNQLRSAELLLVLSGLTHLFVAPYTKVEESFSLHAIRDILSLGVAPSVVNNYDHVSFPGAVPRSFIGPLALSGFTYPFLYLGKAFDLWTTELQVQLLIRLVLLLLSCVSIIFLGRRVKDAFNPMVATSFLLLLTSQFHILFWASRTLPNMLAFPLVQIGAAMLVAPWQARTQKGKGSHIEVLETFGLLTFVALVMRLELLAYLGPLALVSLWRKTSTFRELILLGAVSAILSLGATVAIDSYFWQELIWPEGYSLLFNVVEGHAVEWGVSPWHYYFTNNLPRLLPSLPFAVWAMLIDRRARAIGYPALTFIALLSCLEHKEWRFCVYALPSLTICSAAGIQSLRQLRSKTTQRVVLATFLAINLLVTVFGSYASIHNYPGGEAMSALTLIPSPPTVCSVHIDSHAAMTGASRFLHPYQVKPPWYLSPSPSSPTSWIYNRSETITHATEFETFDFVVTGTPLFHSGAFEEVTSLTEFERFKIDWREVVAFRWPIEAVMRDSVWVMRNKKSELD